MTQEELLARTFDKGFRIGLVAGLLIAILSVLIPIVVSLYVYS